MMNHLKQIAWRIACWIGRRFKRFWAIIWGTDTPLAVTVLLALLAAYLSPILTERFERQRMRSEYVLENLRELNSLISDLYVNVTVINHTVADGRNAPKANIEAARSTLAKLNWKIIETATMLPKSQRRILHQFQMETRKVNESLNGKLDLAACQILMGRLNNMALSGAQSIQAVGMHVELGGDYRTDSLEALPAN